MRVEGTLRIRVLDELKPGHETSTLFVAIAEPPETLPRVASESTHLRRFDGFREFDRHPVSRNIGDANRRTAWACSVIPFQEPHSQENHGKLLVNRRQN